MWGACASGDVELKPVGKSSSSGEALASGPSDPGGRHAATALPPMLPPAKSRSRSSAAPNKKKEARVVVYSTVANPVGGAAASDEGEGDHRGVVDEGREVRFRGGGSPDRSHDRSHDGHCDMPGQSPFSGGPREPGSEKRRSGGEIPSMWL